MPDSDDVKQTKSGHDRKQKKSGRREIIKLAGAVGVVASILPTSWTKPILKTVVVPAHAQTTPVVVGPTGPAGAAGATGATGATGDFED